MTSNPSCAYRINNLGQVVGYSYSGGSAVWWAFIYSNDNMMKLGPWGNGSSYAYGINDSGQIVGSSPINYGSAAHAFIYSNGTVSDLGTLTGYTLSAGYGINSLGQVVGECWTNIPINHHAFLYSNGAMVDLGRRLGRQRVLCLRHQQFRAGGGPIFGLQLRTRLHLFRRHHDRSEQHDCRVLGLGSHGHGPLTTMV